MNSIMINWKTSLGGVMLIAIGLMGALLGIKIQGFTMDPGAAITLGLSLLMAQDANQTPAPSAKTLIAIFFLPLTIVALLAWSSVARAADVNSPVATFDKAISSGSACTPTSCTGWYLGAGLGGIGTNLNVIGNGLNGSAFAGGMLPTIDGGYLYAKNGWLFGANATASYQTNTTTTVGGVGGNQNGLLFTEGVMFGGNFQQLFGSNFQSPVTIPPSLANAVINIYGEAGIAQHQLAGGFVSGQYGGAGLLLDTGAHSFVKVDYKNIQYGATKNGLASFNSENIVTVGWNYKF